MIKIENTEVYGWEAAIRGARNPMNSWAKSDSGMVVGCDAVSGFAVGRDDLKLMQNLANAGDDHGKFMRMIHVQCDVTAPLYWWKEADQYKVGTVTDSCSTMHKIHAKEFVMADFSTERLRGRYDNGLIAVDSPLGKLRAIVAELNRWRDIYNDGGCDDNHDGTMTYFMPNSKEAWFQMIQLLPSSYNQKRTWDLNYAVLKNIYHARKNHKLNEWRELCSWIEGLPYSTLITGEE